MLSPPIRTEINHRTMKFIVGVIAISLAFLTKLFSGQPLTSVSASYYAQGWSQTIFIGFLYAIAAFLLAYNGLSQREMVLSKITAIAALGVAMFPCACDGHRQLVPGVHYLSATIMFLALALFCLIFYRRARRKGHPEALRRAVIYALCGIAILASILSIAVDHFNHDFLIKAFPGFTFYAEGAALIAFGIAWLTASHTLPLLTRKDERFALLGMQITDN
jgi:peptidoglycan/LPS O-acetylase OafA/YrhL